MMQVSMLLLLALIGLLALVLILQPLLHLPFLDLPTTLLMLLLLWLPAMLVWLIRLGGI